MYAVDAGSLPGTGINGDNGDNGIKHCSSRSALHETARIFDCDTGSHGKHGRRDFIIMRELGRTVLFGEIEAARTQSVHIDRESEKRRGVRVVRGRAPITVGVILEIELYEPHEDRIGGKSGTRPAIGRDPPDGLADAAA
jgi:hypothetical protein